MSALLRSMVDDHARTETYVGSLMHDAKWLDEQQIEVDPSVWRRFAQSIAEDDDYEAMGIMRQALSRLAREEAERSIRNEAEDRIP